MIREMQKTLQPFVGMRRLIAREQSIIIGAQAMNRPFVGTIAILILLLVTASRSLCGESHFEKKFSAVPGGTLTLRTDVGSIVIHGTGSSEVSVVADIRGRERDVKKFEITAKQTSAGVEVTGRTSHGGWRFFNWSDLEVQFTVKVPNEYNITTTTSGGEIEIRDLKGTVHGETSGGDIALADIEGGILISTSGGQISLERVNGNVNAETSGGDITANAVVGDIEVGTSGGNIHMNDIAGRVRAETSGGDIVVKLKGNNKGIYAETSGGDIDVIVAGHIAATIDAETSGGDVTCDLPLTITGKVNESRIHGSINGGGNTIHAHTSGGDIRIRTSDGSTKR